MLFKKQISLEKVIWTMSYFYKELKKPRFGINNANLGIRRMLNLIYSKEE